jgi:hypothetical protein
MSPRARPDAGLRSIFRSSLPDIDWFSIETGGTGRGIPDSNGCVGGVEFWIEYKQTDGWAVTLRPEQVGCISRRVRHGGRVWVAVRQHCEAGPRRTARDVLWLVPGGLAAQAKAQGLKALEGSSGVLTWHNGPARWDWAAIRSALLS